MLLKGNALKLLVKNVLIPAIDAAIDMKMFGSRFITLVISTEEMEGNQKIVKLLENSGLSIKGFSETIKNKAKEQKGGYFGKLLGTSGTSFLGNLFTGQGKIRVGEGQLEQVKSFNAAQPLTNLKI